MKILVVIRSSPTRRLLIHLQSPELVEEIAGLAAERKHSQAIATAIAKGRFEREITDSDLPRVKFSFILTDQNISWDITK